MNAEEKLNVFGSEVATIKSGTFREMAREGIKTLPDYFFIIPASSTGKYHPDYSLGEGGLVRHVKGVVRIALELFHMDMFNFTDEEKDLMLVAILLHDGWKNGTNGSTYTVTEHPLVAVDMIKENSNMALFVGKDQIDFVCHCISTHMGQWRKDYKTSEIVLPEMQTKYQKFVHLCDYLGSRKCLEMNFNVPMTR